MRVRGPSPAPLFRGRDPDARHRPEPQRVGGPAESVGERARRSSTLSQSRRPCGAIGKWRQEKGKEEAPLTSTWMSGCWRWSEGTSFVLLFFRSLYLFSLTSSSHAVAANAVRSQRRSTGSRGIGTSTARASSGWLSVPSCSLLCVCVWRLSFLLLLLLFPLAPHSTHSPPPPPPTHTHHLRHKIWVARGMPKARICEWCVRAEWERRAFRWDDVTCVQ